MGSSGTEPTLDALWSVHEIQQLAYRFALGHDTRDMALLETLFVDHREPLEWPSLNIENLRRSLPIGLRRAGPTMLFVANHIIDLEGADRASGKVYCLARLSVGDTWVEQAIMYLDRYRRIDGTWLIDERRHLLWYGVELDERPFDQAKTQWPVSPVGRGSLPEEFPAWRDFYGIDEAPTGFYASPEVDERWDEYTNAGAAPNTTEPDPGAA